MTTVTSPPVPDRYPAWELALNHRDALGPGSLPRPTPISGQDERRTPSPQPRPAGLRPPRTRSTYPGAPVRTWVARR